MNISNYGTQYVLINNDRILSLEEATEVFKEAFSKVRLVSPMLGASFDGSHLIPSADFMGKQYLKCEFMAQVKTQGIEVVKISKVRRNAAKAKRRNLKAVDSETVEYASESESMEQYALKA